MGGFTDVISITDISREGIHSILTWAKKFKSGYKVDLSGKILATLFYEPSSRTKNSFASAMHKLNGRVIGFSGTQSTSVRKGETLHDTIKMFELYSDIIVLRHPKDGAARWAADVSNKPVINAGDGKNQHPTQTLLDLFTILESQGTLENLHVALVGDLKYGRTVHSLAVALSLYNARLYFVSPEDLKMPSYIKDVLKSRKTVFSEHRKIAEVFKPSDIIYMTRIQRERFQDENEFEKVRGAYVLKPNILWDCKPTMKILHPLPRIDEIDISVDSTKHAYYFEQAENGIYVRQAIISMLLGFIEVDFNGINQKQSL
jgi:aspartate carbamoyltransferase catalytic subunit